MQIKFRSLSTKLLLQMTMFILIFNTPNLISLSYDHITVENIHKLEQVAILDSKPLNSPPTLQMFDYEFSIDGHVLVLKYVDVKTFSNRTNQLQVWDMQTISLRSVFTFETEVGSFSVSDNGQLLSIMLEMPDGYKLVLVDTQTQKESMTKSLGQVRDLTAFSPDGQLLFFPEVLDGVRNLIIWDIQKTLNWGYCHLWHLLRLHLVLMD